MTDEKKILWKGRMPEEIRVMLSDSGVAVSQNEGEASQCKFRYGAGKDSNISMSEVDWTKIQEVPKVFFSENILEWDIPQLIFKRLLAGEGSLGSEENYKGVLLKAGTFKISNPGSLGYFSDLLANFPNNLKVNPVNVRSFSVNLFSFLDYLIQSDLVSYPIDVDYGVSQDCFFIQVHCDYQALHLENILDSTQETDATNPMKSLIGEALQKTDLLELYTLKSSNKFVMSSCWVGNPNFIRGQGTPSLLIHQLDSFKATKEKRGRSPEVQTITNHSLEDFQRIKIAESLPKKYQKEKTSNIQMTINPILVKRLVTFIKENSGTDSFDDFTLEKLRGFYPRFPDKEAIKRINELEEDEILNILKNSSNSIEDEVEKVKEKIPPQDYLSKIVSSLENMSFDEAVVAADYDSEDDDVVETLGGRSEDEGDQQEIKGEREDLAEEIQRVTGQREDLTEETQRVAGQKEDLTEEAQRVAGQKEDLTEESERVAGQKEDLTEETQMISGQKEDLTEESQKVSGEKEDLAEEVQRVSSEEEEQSEEVQVVSNNKKVDKPKLVTIKGDDAPKEPSELKLKTLQKDPEEQKVWELKRVKVVKKIKEKAAELQSQGLSNKEIDESIKTILSEELNLSDEKSQHFAKTLSDDASDDIVNEGIDVLNENIKQRFRLEKVENQLDLREKQVAKMKQLIEGLKRELSGTKGRLGELENDSPLSNPNAENFNQVPVNEEVASAQAERAISKTEPTEVAESETPAPIQTSGANEHKVKNIELERELTKISLEKDKLESENEVLLRKLKEGAEEVQEIKGSDEDTEELKKRNENLESQVESLKKRLSFMYENSKTSNDIEIGANEVQKVIEDKERFFKEKMEVQEQLDIVKADLRERDRVIKQEDLEIQQKSDLLKNQPVGEEQDTVREMEKEAVALKNQIKEQAEEIKATQLKSKSFEQKVKFLNAQLQTFQNTPSKRAGAAGGGGVDPKLANKLKQAEKMSQRFKEAGEKIQKELGEKKTELHRTKLENKTLSLKVKDLEKKLLNLAKKKAV